ncbi:MAG: alpha/beta fold hydrolase [Selenomonadaceae bacterium]|nr:alpha/beta fold hydrolase [Selenomonadaceae bacterium]
MRLKSVGITLLAMSVTASYALAFERPVMLEEQGSFMAGGKTITAEGSYNSTEPTNFAGHTLHGDHAYVFYQKPMQAKKYGLVFLHGYGQSGKTWETTPDGRDGFQNIFLERGYATYLVDEPRRGKAGRSTVPQTITAHPDDQLWFNTFRIGEWPNFYDNVAVPKDEEALSQFFHQMTPDTGAFDPKVVADAMVAVFEKIGEGVLVTHSAGGGPGWETAMRSSNVKGIISLEPGTFPFPEGEVLETEATTSPFPAIGTPVPMADFLKLTKIPIVVYFGDNIPVGDTPVANWGQDNWRVRLNLARKWEQVMKKYGGDVRIVYLPDIGIKGNTHFLMADLNNEEIAELMENWLKEKGFDAK